MFTAETQLVVLASEASIASAFYLLSFEQEYCLKKMEVEGQNVTLATFLQLRQSKK